MPANADKWKGWQENKKENIFETPTRSKIN